MKPGLEFGLERAFCGVEISPLSQRCQCWAVMRIALGSFEDEAGIEVSMPSGSDNILLI